MKKPDKFTLEDINRVVDAITRANLSKVDVLAVCIIGCDYGYDFIRLGDVLFQTKVFIEIAVFRKAIKLGTAIGAWAMKYFHGTGTSLAILTESSTSMTVFRTAGKYLEVIGQVEKAIWLGALINFVVKAVEYWPELYSAYKTAVEFEKQVERAINIFPSWLEELIDRVKYYSGEI